MDKQPLRIGILGSYGGLNMGDEAILSAIVKQLREALPTSITVFSRNPEDTLQRHEIEHAVPVREMTRGEITDEVKQLDLLILGGGGILYDGEAEAYLHGVALAHEADVPVMVYAISAGPLADPRIREAVRENLNKAALITVRDRQSHKLLEEVGVDREIQVTADPALLIEAEPLPADAFDREGINPEHRLVGLSVREPGSAAPDIDVDHYHRLLANTADFMVDRLDADIVFVPMERQHKDIQHSHAVVSQMQHAQQATVLKGEYSPGQLVTLISHFEFAVGMRLHFLIFAALQNVPFVALPYAAKVKGFIEELEMDMPELEHVSAGTLIAQIDHSWDWRDDICARIERLLPGLQQRARNTNELLVHLLSESHALSLNQ